MIRVSSHDFGNEVSRYQDAAMTEPVVVTRDGRDLAVMISADEYRRLKRHDRQVFASGETPEKLVDAVRAARMDQRHEHLNDLVEDWTP